MTAGDRIAHKEVDMADQTTEQDASRDHDDGADTAALQAENAALNERLLRALADTENTRRRAERVTEEARQYAVSDFARQLLEIADNLERALAAAETQSPGGVRDASLTEGVQATQHTLLSLLERFGIRQIQALGATFDPAFHEAMMEDDDPSHAPGTVARVLQNGYTIHDRLLRPARVAVVKRSADPTNSNAKPHAADRPH
ncbi:MAG: putative heat shock protein grpE [Microvirga sp.]|jgi:molecular chaperone GrpE|nr:putative heat shock protein grpE [Microvirga sp.]